MPGLQDVQTKHHRGASKKSGTWPRHTAVWRWASACKKNCAAGLRRLFLSHLLEGQKSFKVVVLVGQKRSGNHILLHWYMSQCLGASLLLYHIPPHQYPVKHRSREMRFRLSKSHSTLIFSYEDETPETVLSDRLKDFLSRYEAQIADIRLCHMLRDPRNLIVSRMQKWPEEFESRERLSKVREGYLHNERLALSSPPFFDGLPFVPVFFNALISSPSYRGKLAAQLGIPDGVKSLDEVPSYGHGSSFVGQDKDGNAGDISVFSRWRALNDDPRFIAVFDTPEMRDMISCFDQLLERFEPRISQ